MCKCKVFIHSKSGPDDELFLNLSTKFTHTGGGGGGGEDLLHIGMHRVVKNFFHHPNIKPVVLHNTQHITLNGTHKISKLRLRYTTLTLTYTTSATELHNTYYVIYHSYKSEAKT